MKHWKGIASALVVAAILVALTALVTGCTEPPVAGLTADKTTVAVGENVQFSNTSTGEIASWSWDFGDGNMSSQENPFHAYADEGNYNVSLTVSNKAGSDMASLAIMVFGPPSAAFSVSETKTKPGSSTQFMDKTAGEIDSWLWDFGDGNTSTEQNPAHTYAERGDYTVSLTVSNKAGSDTDTLPIVVLAPPNANFSASEARAKVNSSIQFTDESTGDIDSWLWDFGDGSTSTEQNPSHTYRDAGTYTVSLTVSNAINEDTRKKEDYITVTAFTVSRLVMCSDVTDEGDYTPQPDATYHVGDPAWIYFKVTGFEERKADGDYEFWLQWQSLRIFNPDGSLLVDLTGLVDRHGTDPPPVLGDVWSAWFSLGKAESTDPLGEYRVEVKVVDKLTGDMATESTTFVLE